MRQHIVILGAPGVGKGTQAKKLASDFSWIHISTGDMLRQAMQDGSALGKKARRYVEKGDLVPDDLIIKMVSSRLDQKDGQNGFILDGFPRTVLQADKLEALLEEKIMKLNGVVSIEVPDEEIIQRLSKRYLCEKCGPVIVDAGIQDTAPLCPDCGQAVARRKDDEPETIGHRLKVYNERTRSLIHYYEGRKLLRRIDGRGSVDEIYQRILEALDVSQVNV